MAVIPMTPRLLRLVLRFGHPCLFGFALSAWSLSVLSWFFRLCLDFAHQLDIIVVTPKEPVLGKSAGDAQHAQRRAGINLVADR